MSAALLLAIFAGGGAMAQNAVQGVPNAMQGFSQNRDQPIQIEAASLELRDKQKEATFSGDVKVVQGDTTMKSKSLVVFYDGGGSKDQAAGNAPATKGAQKGQLKAAQPGPGGSSAIRRLEARGNVVVTQKDQVVTGESAVFETTKNLVTMTGGGPNGVVLTQGKNILRGDKLVVDLTTGTSRVEGGRVQMLLQPGDQKQGGSGPSGPTSIIPGGRPR